jgi:hypothetical protein
MLKAFKTILALLGAEVVALVIALILCGVNESGVVTVQITHVLFWLAFATSVIAAPLAAWVCWQSIWRSLLCLIGVVIVVGGGLWWLDSKLTQMKAAQDAASRPVPSVPSTLYAPSPRSSALTKTPKSWFLEPRIGGNGNVVGNKIKGDNNVIAGGGNTQQGNCNINQEGTNNQATATCGAPERHFPKAAADSLKQCMAESVKQNPSQVVVLDMMPGTKQFSEELWSALNGAGLTVHPLYTMMGYPPPPALLVSAGPNKQGLALVVFHCFSAIRPKLDMYPKPLGERDPDLLKITVGEFPQ